MDPTRKRDNKIFRYDRRLKENMEVKKLISDVCRENSHAKVEDRLALCRRAIVRWSKTHQENNKKIIAMFKKQLEEEMKGGLHDDTIINDLNTKLLKHTKRKKNSGNKEFDNCG